MVLNIAHFKIAIISVSVFPILVFLRPARTQPPQWTPDELMRQVVSNELRAEDQDHSHWMFRLETKKNAQTEVDEVVETNDGDLKRPILVNGHELTAKQQQESDKQLEQFVHNPESLRKSLKDKNQDAVRSQRLLKMLPDAFLFGYGDRRGGLVELTFKPNPQFHPSSREAEVFHAMEGSIWVDDKENRLVEIAGHLISEVKFGGGLLGHLDKGGTFEVKQEPVARGFWELTALHVEMRGKVLFFKTIGVQQNYSRSNFRRVPDNVTLAQAAQMLREQVRSEEPANSSSITESKDVKPAAAVNHGRLCLP